MFVHLSEALRRAVAGAAAFALLLLSALIVAPAASAEDAPAAGGGATPAATAAPKLSVSKTTGLNPDGETVTVTGSGYSGTQPLYLTTCTDVPLEDVDFNFIAAGCTTGSKLITPTPTKDTQVQLNADGTFQTQLTVKPKGETTAIYTIADYTAMNDRTQDAKTTITFAKPAPKLSVSKTTDLNPDGETVTVTGSGYSGTQPLYLLICTDVPLENVSFDFALPCVRGSKQITPTPTTPTQVRLNADGTFQTELTVTPKGETTAIYTIADHTAMNDRTQDAKTTITFADSTPEPGTPEPGTPEPGTPEPGTPEPSQGPAITVTPTALNPNVDNMLTVSGTGYVGDSAANGVYVLFGSTSTWSGQGALPANGWIAIKWVPSSEIVDGSFTTKLTVPAGTLTTDGNYQVATSAAHGLSLTDRSLDRFLPVSVLSAAGATPQISVMDNSGAPLSAVKPGDTLTISGTGFGAGELVTATVQSTLVTVGTKAADANGAVSFTWTVPADFEGGTHTATLTGASGATLKRQFTVETPATEESKQDEATQTTEEKVCVAYSVTGGSLSWGVRESFRTYITGPIAGGSISTAGGAKQSGGTFVEQ